MKEVYHSALKGFKELGYKCQGFETEDVKSFVFDVENDEIPDAFREVDFVYCEVPYKQGYDVFNERANVKGSSYTNLLAKTLELVNNLKVPFFIVTQKVIMLQPLFRKRLYFPVHDGYIYLYASEDVDCESTHDLLDYLFTKYDVGLDFMCGYGKTGEFATKHKKKVVLTDLNPKCIGYLKDKYES